MQQPVPEVKKRPVLTEDLFVEPANFTERAQRVEHIALVVIHHQRGPEQAGTDDGEQDRKQRDREPLGDSHCRSGGRRFTT